MPHISEWWDTVSDTVKSTFLTLLQDVPSFSPVLILATAETHYPKLSDEVGAQRLFLFFTFCLDVTVDAVPSALSEWGVLTLLYGIRG